MRESIGGGWLFGIVIVFIFMFSGFLAYSVSYTRAFNVKNEIINYIEQGQGFTKSDKPVENIREQNILLSTTEGKVYNLISKSGYDWEANIDSECPSDPTHSNQWNWHGACIEKFCPSTDENLKLTNDVHYKVTTFMTFKIPFFGIKFTIPLSGETSKIKADYSGYDCIK